MEVVEVEKEPQEEAEENERASKVAAFSSRCGKVITNVKPLKVGSWTKSWSAWASCYQERDKGKTKRFQKLQWSYWMQMTPRKVQILVSGDDITIQNITYIASLYFIKYTLYFMLPVKPLWNFYFTVHHRSRRKSSEVPNMSREDLEAEAGSECTFSVNF